MRILEPKVIHDIYEGVIEGDAVKYYEKRFGQVFELYENSEGIDEEKLAYTVYSYEQGEANKMGNLNWGLTILEPLYVNEECNMTRGHFHEDTNCAEFYFGISGSGLLLLMNENGEMWAEKVFKGSLHHIDGAIAHRLVNTGYMQCKVGACWPTTAGHNYEAIERQDFPYRVFNRSGKIEFKKR